MGIERSCLRTLSPLGIRQQLSKRAPRRHFSASLRCSTDGVYAELTAMRTRTPFIDAFRKQQQLLQEGKESVVETASPSQPDVTPKRMSDSYHTVTIPLGQDPWLLDRYINSSGHIRLGTLFMDLDAAAGVVAYKHTGDSVMTVTAAVDRITLKNSLSEIGDLQLSGNVTFATGRSSMEVSLQVAKAPLAGNTVKEEDVLMTCAFTMVSLNPSTKKPVNIAPLICETPEEKRLYELGQKQYDAKKALSRITLRRQTPNDEESDLIHNMWLRQLDYHDPNTAARKPAEAVYMSSSQISSVQIMQPQYRNRHNFMIFGGFLLKSTFELAFTCASSIAHARPTFLALDPSTFENPVPVGSVLYMTATVAYTDSPLIETSGDIKASPEGSTRIQVRVDTKVRNVEHGETKPTGQFNYTFEVPKDVKIVPRTYSELMMYLDARRRAQLVAKSIEKGDTTIAEITDKGGVMQ